MKQIARILIIINSIALLPLGPARSVELLQSHMTLEKASVELMDGGIQSDGRYLTGLSIVLNPGVKTYWRMPGDSGLPPVFDFTASRNVDHVEVKWPAPLRIEEADGTILGFKDQVIFPLIITPKDVTQPATLAVTIDFGLCDTLCLPAKATLTRDLKKTDGNAPSRSDIDAFLGRVPLQGQVKGHTSPSITGIETMATSPPALNILIRSATPLKDLIIEGPDGWYFGLGPVTAVGGELYRVIVPIDQKPSTGVLSGLGLTLTAIAEGSSTETRLTLDATGAIR